MFAPLKRTLILATLLVLPGLAMANTTVDDIIVNNEVQDGATTVPITVKGTVYTKDWKSTWIEFDDGGLSDVCVNHANTAGKTSGYTEAEWTEIITLTSGSFDNSDGDEWFDVYTYADDNCGGPSTQQNVRRNYVNAGIVSFGENQTVELTNFIVMKSFGNHDVDDIVQIAINCNDGHVHPDTAPIADDGIHNFVVENLHPGNPDVHCTVTETSGVAGFEAQYWTGTNFEGPGHGSDDAYNTTGCVFSGAGNMSVGEGERPAPNYCLIYNAPLPATFTVTKKWEIFNDSDLDGKGEGTVRDTVRIHVECDGAHVFGAILTDDNNPMGSSVETGNRSVHVKMEGDGSLEVEVGTRRTNPTCYAWESYHNSAIEQTEDTCYVPGQGQVITRGNGNGNGFIDMGHELKPGGSASCGFTNTIFFEGIPTLSQYGMAIMALLMLGLGFVGFRRFV